MKVKVDVDRCVAAGACVLASPLVFDQNDDDGAVIVLQTDPPEESFEAVRKAAALCPASVITIEEDE
jgi:ferredoxin